MDQLWRDLRYAARTLSRSPGFLTVAVLSLALGIGANTAIFSLIDAVMLRLLPVAHPEQLVLLTDPGESFIAVETTQHGERTMLSYPEFEQLRSHNTVFSSMFAAESELSDVTIFKRDGLNEQSAKAHVQLVSGEFFGVLDVKPVRGRVFMPQEDRVLGANPVGVLSYAFWQREFAGDPAVIGSSIRVGRADFQIVGVAPETFRGMLIGTDADIWFPITMQEQVLPGRTYLKMRDTLWLQVMGRLREGTSPQRAEAGINVEFQQILNAWAGSALSAQQRKKLLDQKIRVRPGARGASALRDQFSDPLTILMAMVGVVLLIACANIANLMLARATGRSREIGVRLAVGASRGRLIRQMLTESILVAALGGILGAIVAEWGTGLLVALVSGGSDNITLQVHHDYRVFLFTAVTSLLTGVLFGLAPALRATRVDVNQTLAANARGAIAARGGVRTGRILVVAQVALSLLLIMGATLFARSLHNVLVQKLGYSREHLLMMRIDPVTAGYKGAATSALYQKLMENFGRIHGVENVTVSQSGLFGGDTGDPISLDGAMPRSPSEMHSRWSLVGPDYFATMGIPLLRGREIQLADAIHGAPVCVINQAFARYYFGDSDPIGKHVTDEYPTTRVTFQIVGVAADAREHRLRGPQDPRFYGNLFHPIGTVDAVTFLVRTSAEDSGVVPAMRRAVAQIDPMLPVLHIRTLSEQLDRRLVTERLIAQLSAFFGGVALIMAAIGLYGVMSYSISRRTSEIGIRMALGASHGSALWMVLRETLWLVGIGVAIGLPCALAAGRVIANRLYGITPTDPIGIAMAVGIVLSTAILAGYFPARRAAGIDPMNALRHE